MNPSASAAPLTIACMQMAPVIGEKSLDPTRSLTMIEQAADAGAGLVLLLELCTTGYVFATREEAFALASTTKRYRNKAPP